MVYRVSNVWALYGWVLSLIYINSEEENKPFLAREIGRIALCLVDSREKTYIHLLSRSCLFVFYTRLFLQLQKRGAIDKIHVFFYA